MKKILVTGANGLLGQKLIGLLKSQSEFAYIGTARGENRTQDADIQYRALDITNQEEVLKVIGEEKPDYIINTAAMTNVDQCETEKEACRLLNVEAVKFLVEAAKLNKAFLLHVSTDFIFDGLDGPYSEEAKPNPISFYGQSKADAEEVVIQSGIDWAIARTVLVYGITPGMSRTNIILWVKSSLEQGKTIQVVNDQFRSPTLAEDLAMGCFLICKHHAKGIYNISGSDFMTPFEMAIATADYFNLNKNLIVETDGSKFSQPAKRPPRTGFIIEKARKELGYNPKTFKEGIEILAKQTQELSV